MTSSRTKLQSIRSDISAVQGDEAALKTAGLLPVSGPDSADSTAQQHVSEATTTTNQAVDQMNADDSIANEVATAPCAWDGPGAAPAGLSLSL